MKTNFTLTFHFNFLNFFIRQTKKRIVLGSVETWLDGGEVDVCEVHLGGDQPAGGQLVSSSISGDIPL